MSFERFVTAAGCFTVALAMVSIGYYLYEKQSYRRDLTDYAAEMRYVQGELMRRCADDCVMSRTDYGYMCREIKTDKVFKVVLR